MSAREIASWIGHSSTKKVYEACWAHNLDEARKPVVAKDDFTSGGSWGTLAEGIPGLENMKN